MRHDLCNLPPPEERPPFIDPDRDHRDDPVSRWLTPVHVAFMARAIINAHYPTLIIAGLRMGRSGISSAAA